MSAAQYNFSNLFEHVMIPPAHERVCPGAPKAPRKAELPESISADVYRELFAAHVMAAGQKAMQDAAEKLMTQLTGRCKASTKSGSQCSRQAGGSKGTVHYCWQHAQMGLPEPAGVAPSAPLKERPVVKYEAPVAAAPAPAVTDGKCQATTKAGSQCSRKAGAGGQYCWQHAK